MHAIADPPITRHRITVDDYYRMAGAGILGEDDRVELINGEIVDKAPIGSPHAGSLHRLTHLFSQVLHEQAILSIQNPVRLDSYNEPQPDLALLRPCGDFYSRSHPQADDVLLIVEVAETSLAYDLKIKLPLYARHGIPEVWVLDLNGHCLNLFSRPEDGAYKDSSTLTQAGPLAPLMLPQARIELEGLI